MKPAAPSGTLTVLMNGTKKSVSAGTCAVRYSNTRGAESEHRLPEILPARGQAARIADHQLQVVVAETDHAEADRHAERDPDEAIAQIRPQQRADHDRDDDQRAAHGRRAGLRQMRSRPFIAHHLADLVARQPRDHRRADQQRHATAPTSRPGSRAASGTRTRGRRRVVYRQQLRDPVEHRSLPVLPLRCRGRRQRLDHALEAIDARALDQQPHVGRERRHRARASVRRHRDSARRPRRSCRRPAPRARRTRTAARPRGCAPARRARGGCPSANSPSSAISPSTSQRRPGSSRSTSSPARAASSGWRCRNHRSARHRRASRRSCSRPFDRSHAARGRRRSRRASRRRALAAAAAASALTNVVAAGEREPHLDARPAGVRRRKRVAKPCASTSKRSPSARNSACWSQPKRSTRAAVLDAPQRGIGIVGIDDRGAASGRARDHLALGARRRLRASRILPGARRRRW